jgi:hypothetical protein
MHAVPWPHHAAGAESAEMAKNSLFLAVRAAVKLPSIILAAAVWAIPVEYHGVRDLREIYCLRVACRLNRKS